MTQTANRAEAAPIYSSEPYGIRWWMIAVVHPPLLVVPWAVLPIYPWRTWVADGIRNTSDPLGLLLGFEGIFVGAAVALAFFQTKDWSSLRQRTITAAAAEVRREDTVFIVLVLLIWASAGLVILACVAAHVKDNFFYWSLVPFFVMLHLVIAGALMVLRQSGAGDAAAVYRRVVRLARIHALNPSADSPTPQSQQHPSGRWQQLKQVWRRWRPWSTQMVLASVLFTASAIGLNVAEQHTWEQAYHLLAVMSTMLLICLFSAPLMAYGRLTGDPIVLFSFVGDAAFIITILTWFLNPTTNASTGQALPILFLLGMLFLGIALKVKYWPGRASNKWTKRSRSRVLELAATRVAREGRSRAHNRVSPADVLRAIQEVCDEASPEGRERLRSYLLGALDLNVDTPEKEPSDCSAPVAHAGHTQPKEPTDRSMRLATALGIVALLTHLILHRFSDRG